MLDCWHREALEELEQGHTRGKIVLRMVELVPE